MLSTEQTRAAHELLFEHWQGGSLLAALPAELRPATRAEGYAIQACLEARSSAALFGWKIAATSTAGQAHIGVDGPLAGRLLAERVASSGAELPLTHNRMRVAEPEFAFRMAATLLPRAQAYAVEEVMAAVGELCPAIEVPDSRYTDFTVVGAPQLIADDACADRFVLGPPAGATWRGIDLAAHRVMASLADGRSFAGQGSNVLGDPRAALTWLANELSTLGVPLAAGQVVTTGTCMVPVAIAPGDEVTADFGLLGKVAVRFGA